MARYQNIQSQGVVRTPNVPTHRMRIPANAVDAGEILTVCLNREWLRRVVDVISYMDQPDVWVGTKAEIEAARDESRRLSQMLLEEGDCMVQPMEFELQQAGCGILLFVDGVQAATLEWNPDECPPTNAGDGGLQDIRVVEGMLQAQDADDTWRDIYNICDPECGYIVIYFYDQNCPMNATELVLGTRLSGGEFAPEVQDNGVLYFESIEFEFPFAAPAAINAVSLAWQLDYDTHLESLNIAVGDMQGNAAWGIPWSSVGQDWFAGSYSHVWQADDPQTVPGIRVTVDITYQINDASPGFTIRDMGINGNYPMAEWNDSGTPRRIDYNL